MAVILVFEVSRTIDFIIQVEGAVEAKVAAAQAAVAEAAAVAAVVTAAIFHLLILPPAQPNSSGPSRHAFPASYLPDGYVSAPVDRGSLSRRETQPHQRYEEQGGYELANYAGGGYGDGSSGGAGRGYDYGHLSGGGEFHQQEASRGDGDNYEGYSAADPDSYQPRHYSEPYETSSQQQQERQQQQPYGTSSSSPPAASPSPDPGTSAPAAPLHFVGIAHRVRRGKSGIDTELGDSQKIEGGGRVLRIRMSKALVSSQLPRRPIPQPFGSEKLQADTGASASITNDTSNMFNVREVNPSEEFV